jgi:Emfourin
MKIQMERSGGFTGILFRSSIDTDLLDPKERKALLELVESARFFDLPARFPAVKAGADRFNYKLTIEAKDQSHTVEFNEANIPESLSPLVKQVTLLGRRAPKG